MIKPLASFRRSRSYELFEDLAKVWLLWCVIRAVRGLSVSFGAAWRDVASIPPVVKAVFTSVVPPTGADPIGSMFMTFALVVLVSVVVIRHYST